VCIVIHIVSSMNCSFTFVNALFTHTYSHICFKGDTDSLPLSIVSYVGVGISGVCLLITIIVHLCYWRYGHTPNLKLLFAVKVYMLAQYTYIVPFLNSLHDLDCIYRYLKSDLSILHLNLCMALLLAYTAFLAGVDKSKITVNYYQYT